MEQKEGNVSMPSFSQTLLVMGVTVILIAIGVFVYGVDVHIPIVLELAFASAVGVFVLKRPWEDLAKGMERGVMVAMQGVFILLAVGILIGAWIKSGIVPSMIYYGLCILTPKFFLLASLLICSVVSLATGTSWGTSGSIGLALMGVAAVLVFLLLSRRALLFLEVILVIKCLPFLTLLIWLQLLLGLVFIRTLRL